MKKNQEIRKRLCGTLNEWEYWALFENGVMVSPWLLSEARVLRFIEEYNKGVPPEAVNYHVALDFVKKDYTPHNFDSEKEEKLYLDKDSKLVYLSTEA